LVGLGLSNGEEGEIDGDISGCVGVGGVINGCVSEFAGRTAESDASVSCKGIMLGVAMFCVNIFISFPLSELHRCRLNAILLLALILPANGCTGKSSDRLLRLELIGSLLLFDKGNISISSINKKKRERNKNKKRE
jgi:hypothetical protein